MNEGLSVNEREIVIPGDGLAKGMDFLPGVGTYRQGETIYAKRLGLVHISGRVITLVALNGTYSPKVGDKIICRVYDILMSGWLVNTNTPYNALLSMAEASNRFIKSSSNLSSIFDIGTYLKAVITKVTSQRLIDISLTKEPGLGKLEGGRMFTVSPEKVPRIIGRAGSMINTIKDSTGCDIVIGQNGRVWIRGGDPVKERLAQQAVLMIEKQSHIQGLTDKISKFLGESQ